MKLDQIFIATKNKGKLAEFAAFFQEKGIRVKSLLDLDEDVDVEENGRTFEENAVKKAEVIGQVINQPVLADDSGLEVDALNGEPGIFSARFAGAEKSDQANNEKLLEELAGVDDEKRTARFICVLAIYIPGQKTLTFRGACEGVIGHEPKGTNGFGYDPLFYLPSLNKTMAQLDKTEKNQISHRSNALNILGNEWDKLLYG